MANFKSRYQRGSACLAFLIFGASRSNAQRVPQGYAVERFYPSAPGAGWFVMDDVNLSGGLGGHALAHDRLCAKSTHHYASRRNAATRTTVE